MAQEGENRNQQRPPYDDEIDVQTLFSLIGRFFKRIWDGFIGIFVGIRRSTINNWQLMAGVCVVGIIIGLLLFQKSEPYYRTSMILRSEHHSLAVMKASIERLTLLCQEKNYDQLAKRLGMSKVQGKELKGFYVELIEEEEDLREQEVFKAKLEGMIDKSKVEDKEKYQEMLDKLLVHLKSYYQVSVEVYDPEVIDELEAALTAYFKNSDYLQRRLSIREKNLEMKDKQLQNEMDRLDSLKNAYYLSLINMADKNRHGSNNVVLADPQLSQEPLNLFEQSKEILEEQMKTKESLYLGHGFEVVEGFTSFRKPSSPDIFAHLGFTLLISLGIAYVLVSLVAFNAYLARKEKH